MSEDRPTYGKKRRGAVVPSPGRSRVTVMLDDDLLAELDRRSELAGRGGYVDDINQAIRQYLEATGGIRTELPASHPRPARLASWRP